MHGKFGYRDYVFGKRDVASLKGGRDATQDNPISSGCYFATISRVPLDDVACYNVNVTKGQDFNSFLNVRAMARSMNGLLYEVYFNTRSAISLIS